MGFRLPETVGVIGSDEVAAGWAARFLAQGLDVVGLVEDGAGEAQLREGIERAWPILVKLGLLPGASRARLGVVTEVAAWAERVNFGQCGMGIGNWMETAVPAPITLAVPTYNPPYQHPGRVVAARVPEPVYLSPLVEVWGQEERIVAETAEFYHHLAMQPVITNQPIAGRLEAALRREAHKLRQEGVDEGQIEAALQYGLALAWSIGGLSGKVAASVRDEALLGMMRTLRQYEVGAGKSIAAHDVRRYTTVEHHPWQPGEGVEAPLRLYRCDVDANWIDYNGHMTESSYLVAFGDASDALFRYIGIDEAYRAAGNSYYTVETHINYYLECGSGDTLAFTTQVLDFDARRLHFFHTMSNSASGQLVCTTEQMLVHVDTAVGRAAAAKPHVLEALTAVLATHKQLPIPKQVGRQMRIVKK
jgi:carnitine 3-dehydrogenase